MRSPTRLKGRSLLVEVTVLSLLIMSGYGVSLIPSGLSIAMTAAERHVFTAVPSATASPPPTTLLTAILFDFDTGVPVLAEGHNTPLDQTAGGVTAHFSSPSGPAAFSIQSQATTFYQLSQFSGKYLFDNKLSRDALDVTFSHPLTSINFTFATLEYHGGSGVEPSYIQLTAYLDSVDSTPLGSTTARGTWPTGDSYPQGTLAFEAGGQPFNVVRIALPFQPQGATDVLFDTIWVTATTVEDTTPPVTTLSLTGTLGSLNWYTSDVTISLSATDASGVARIEYRLDDVTWTPYTAPFTLTQEGPSHVQYRATDTQGNTEAAQARLVNIDKTPPTGSIVINANAATTSSASVTLTVTSYDAASGAAMVRYSNDGEWKDATWELPSPTKTWTLPAGNGTKTVYYQLKDHAGLTSETYQDSILLSDNSGLRVPIVEVTAGLLMAVTVLVVAVQRKWIRV